MGKRLLYSLLATLLQTILYLTLVVLFGLLFIVLGGDSYKDFVLLGIMYATFFAFPCLLFNVIDAIIGKSWFKYISIGLPLSFYLFGWFEDINSWTLQTILFLIIGTISYLSNIRLEKLIIKKYAA